MRLAMIITKVDEEDSVYGANIAWIRALAERVEHLTVVGMSVGRHTLPGNTTVLSLGKEKGASRLSRLLRFERIMLPLVLARRVDGVFVHQGQVWGPLMAYARLSRTPVVLFKAHGTMARSIKWYLPFFDRVASTTTDTFPIETDKKFAVGQGIDVDRFQPRAHPAPLGDKGFVSLVTVGRLSPIRRYEVLIDAVAHLRAGGRWEPTLHIYGEAYAPEMRAYAEELGRQAERLGLTDHLCFHGTVANAELPGLLGSSAVYLNASTATSALDKSVLEAMACEIPVISSNPRFADLFGPYSDMLYCASGDAQALARSVERVLELGDDERRRIGAHLRKGVVREHNVERLMDRIVDAIASVRK